MGKQFLPLIRRHVTNVINTKVTISLKTSDISQTTHMRPYDAEEKLEDTKEETETENIWS